MRVASFLPSRPLLSKRPSFIEQELIKARSPSAKNDNAFLAIDDVAALQAAADRLSPQIIQKQLDYWTLILGPKSPAPSASDQPVALLRHRAVELLPQLHLQRNFPIHKISNAAARSAFGD